VDIIFWKHNLKKILKIQWGEFELGTLVGLPTAIRQVWTAG